MARGWGHGVASVDPVEGGDGATGPESSERLPLTDSLGCTETRVDAFHLAPADPVDLPRDREQVVVSLARAASLTLDGAAVPPGGVGRVPPDAPCSLGVETGRGSKTGTGTGTESRSGNASGGTAVVVSVPGASAAASDAEPAILDLDRVPYRVPSTSDVPTARLTTPLGCIGVKTNARVLEPDQVVPTHTEGSQEELFVPVAGPAAMGIGEETVATPPGTVVRVAPETPRSAFTDGTTESRWVMFGAPPTGGPEEWDPGAEILD